MAKNIQGLSALTKVTKSLPHFSFRIKNKLQTQNIEKLQLQTAYQIGPS